jgi:hypothetical protein
MLSIQLMRLIVEEREHDVQRELRVRRLLRGSVPADSAPATEQGQAVYRDSWRARTPRASATTR